MFTASQLRTLALSYLNFTPLPQQDNLITALSSFICDGGKMDIFVINGYAGTGKTSVVGAIIKAMRAVGQKIVLLAPTGRAAKVAQSFSGLYASTIHKRIFRGGGANPSDTNLFLATNTSSDTIFIVDEASLIYDLPGNPQRSLLFQLLRYVYTGKNCRLVLIGDDAQLPPVGQSESHALDPARLRQFQLNPITARLDIPVRQGKFTGIVFNATVFRHLLFNPRPGFVPEINVSDFPDIRVVDNYELPDLLSDSWGEVGKEQTLIVTRSNYRVNAINKAVRNQVLYSESPLERGERIVISKNDYYWSRKNKLEGFIANGDIAEVTWVGKYEKVYGRYFVDVEMQMAEGGEYVNAKLMVRSLVCEGPNIPRDEMERFYNTVLSTFNGSESSKMKSIEDDPYFNALQAKYAYCVTCHKAQGGQWRHVYIDMAGIDTGNLTPEFYRWFYTAITRATERVFLLNPTLPIV